LRLLRLLRTFFRTFLRALCMLRAFRWMETKMVQPIATTFASLHVLFHGRGLSGVTLESGSDLASGGRCARYR